MKDEFSCVNWLITLIINEQSRHFHAWVLMYLPVHLSPRLSGQFVLSDAVVCVYVCIGPRADSRARPRFLEMPRDEPAATVWIAKQVWPRPTPPSCYIFNGHRQTPPPPLRLQLHYVRRDFDLLPDDKLSRYLTLFHSGVNLMGLTLPLTNLFLKTYWTRVYLLYARLKQLY